MPFVTAGDPDLSIHGRVASLPDRAGQQPLRIGHPLQRSDRRRTGDSKTPTRGPCSTRSSWPRSSTCSASVTPELKAPLVSMVSYSIIYRHGLEAYVAAARKAGVAGAIVPDLPVEESAALAEVCRRQDFSLIQLIAPTTPRERALRIAERTSGFIYYVSVTGITGERSELPPQIVGKRRLAPRSDAAADLHRFRHQPAGARADACAGGRRSDRRFGDRASRGRGRDPAAGRPCCKRSATMSPSCCAALAEE